MEAAQDPDDPALAMLVGELSVGREESRSWWAAQGHRGNEPTQAVPTSGRRRPVARLRYVEQPRRRRAASDGPQRRTRQRLPRSTADPRLLDRDSSDLGAADGWVRSELGPLTAHREPASTEVITTVATRTALRRDPAPASFDPAASGGIRC